MITDNYSDVLTAIAEFSDFEFTFGPSFYMMFFMLMLALYACFFGNADALNKIYDK